MTSAGDLRLSDSLARIEAELEALWEPDSTGAAKPRAYTLNLVAVVGLDAGAAFAGLVGEVAARLLARTFTVTVDPKVAPWALSGDVRAVCSVGEQRICAEQVELTFGVMAARRAGSIIEALTEARLRTALLVGPDAPPDVVARLAPACALVVVDSARLGVGASARLAASTRGSVADLAFVRGRRWREMVARLFDEPSARAALPRISAVEITHVERPSGPEATAESALFLGWLGSQLGWRASSGAIVDAAGSPVEVRRSTVVRADVAAGCLDSVTITAGELELAVTREADAEHVRCSVREPGGAPAARRYSIPHREAAEELARAVSDPRGDALVRGALAFAASAPGA